MCFANYITVRADCYADAVAPTSGLYINDLPGLNIYTAGDIADEEYINGIDLFNNKIDFAVEKVKAEVAMKMANWLRVAPALVIDHAGEWLQSSNADWVTGETTARGPEICINQKRHFQMGVISITTVEILWNSTTVGNTLNFTDHLGNVVHTENFDTTAGQVTEITVDQTFSSNRIWVNFDPTGISYNDSAMRVSGCKGCGTNSRLYKDYGYARVRGRTGANGSEAYSLDTYGVNVKFEILCSAEAMLCRLKNFKTVNFLMLYAAGIEVANEAINSTRFNAVTNLRREDFRALRDEWAAEYDRLWDSFADNAAGVLSRFGDECITCKSARVVSARL